VERLYKALAWVAGAALAFGLAFTIMNTSVTLSYYAQVPQIPNYGVLYSALATSLSTGDLGSNIRPIALLLVSGATLLAMALAWADRRWGWLIALISVTILAILWPSAVAAWAVTNMHTLPPVPVTAALAVMTFSVFAAPLVPVALALILALTRHRPAAAAPASAPLTVAPSPQ
jgi:hypothetical protein